MKKQKNINFFLRQNKFLKTFNILLYGIGQKNKQINKKNSIRMTWCFQTLL